MEAEEGRGFWGKGPGRFRDVCEDERGSVETGCRVRESTWRTLRARRSRSHSISHSISQVPGNHQRLLSKAADKLALGKTSLMSQDIFFSFSLFYSPYPQGSLWLREITNAEEMQFPEANALEFR